MARFTKDIQYYKFCLYGFLKNQRFFEPFFILFLLEKDMSYIQIGSIYTIREITRNIFEIPAGFGADVLGRRKTMITSFSLYILSFFLYYIAPAYLIIIIATLFFALGDAFRTGTHKAIIFDYLRMKGWSDQKVHYYGHTRSWSQIGSALSSLIAAALVFFSGNYITIFLYSGFPYLIGLILMITYPAYLDGNVEKLNWHSLKNRFKKIGREFLVTFKNLRMLKAIGNISSHSGYYRAVKDYLQPVIVSLALALPILEKYGDDQRSAVFIGLIYFLIYILTSTAARNAGKFADLFPQLSKPLNMTLFSGLLLGALVGLFYHYQLLIISVTLFVMTYIIENIRRPMAVSYISDNLREDILATALSAEEQSKTIFSAVIALLMGFLADWLGIGPGLLISSSIIIVLLPIIWLRNNGN
jgi:MFS family permease